LDEFLLAKSAPVAVLLAFVPYALLRGRLGFSRVIGSPDPRPAGSTQVLQERTRTMASPDAKFDVNSELAARRTGMAFQRTRMAEDRTLMAVIRTSLSLIGFGFTIYQFFERLREENVITKAAAPRHFGLALVALGVVMLLLGIVYHVQFMLGLRRLRQSMRDERLIYGETIFPVSLTLITALLLLAIGGAAIASMAFQVGPFG
jgi:putative membrane protein